MVTRADVPEEWDVVSPLSFVIDKDDPYVVTSGASRPCTLMSSFEELVRVNSLELVFDAIVVCEARLVEEEPVKSFARCQPGQGS